MANAGWVGGALSALFFLCVLAVAPAAGAPIDDCFDYEDSSWSTTYMTCAGSGGGCSICVGSVVVYKGEDGGDPTPPLGTEFAALLPGSYTGERWLDRGKAAGSFGPTSGFLRVKRACSADPGMFDAVDPRQRPARVPAPRAAVPALQPVPAP